MMIATRTLALTAVSLAGSEVGVAYVPIPIWARICLGAVTAGTIVASAVDSTNTRLELDELRALNQQPLWLRELQEQETLVSAMIVNQHEDAA